jgi:hypothetical protein
MGGKPRGEFLFYSPEASPGFFLDNQKRINDNTGDENERTYYSILDDPGYYCGR